MSADADVVVVGAGLAGLSAAVALSGQGAKCVVLERKPYVGGRAYSYLHPALNDVVDSQHVLLGCCTNLIDLCKASGADAHIRWYDAVTFLEPGGRETKLRAGSAVDFLSAPMLGVKDKLAIARGLMEFLRGYPTDDAEAFSEWLARTKQTELAIRHFWEPVIVGALNDSFERCSTRYAGQVFHESFLKSPQGGRLGIPTQPMTVFYEAVSRLAQAQGVDLRLRASVEKVERADGLWCASVSDGSMVRAPKLVLALPFEQVQKLWPAAVAAEKFVHAPITTLHLWFDRVVTERDHAALLDTRIQWMFNKSRIRRDEPEAVNEVGQYLELVISGSFAELHETREEILGSAMRELEMFFPKVREATLVKSGILKEARATFSVVPGLDAVRPAAAVGDGLFVAGDWTRTGWPSTMEGAVRSGRLAAEAIAGKRAMVDDLRAKGLLKLFA